MADLDREKTYVRTSSDLFEILPIVSLPGQAMFWGHVVRNRFRWFSSESATAGVYKRVEELLHELGLTPEKIKILAGAEVVEVSIPYTQETVGWEHRILPWEFLLSAATRRFRPMRSLTVVRHLRVYHDRLPPEPKASTPVQTSKVLFVASKPGRVAPELISFDTETQYVKTFLGVEDRNFCVLDSPDPDRLKAAIQNCKPDVVHLSGLDVHEAHWRLDETDQLIRDGYMLAQNEKETYKEDDGKTPPAGEAVGVYVEKLAELFKGPHSPDLVCFSIFHSGARLAALAVAEGGAGAAFGIQDQIRDAMTEAFYADFYFALRCLDGGLLLAFQAALRLQAEQEVNLHASGLVLWTRTSLLKPDSIPVAEALTAIQTARQEISDRIPETENPADVYDVSATVEGTLNYSLLHNHRRIFSQFRIRNKKKAFLRKLTAEVELHVGGEACKWTKLVDKQDRPVIELRDEIVLPLTSALIRSLRESVESVIRMKVSCEGKTVFEDTQRVTLLATDEWKDTRELDVFLPSFVLPRDPAIKQVISLAKPYLASLRDDPSAGFDGYQQVIGGQPKTTEVVDLQVQALWFALTVSKPLNYINPPPTFTRNSQRLRFPREVIEGGWGTCIDLTLLLAACLEAVEIYPVIFLLKDHAFPGYWRSDELRQKFLEFRVLEKDIAKTANQLLKDSDRIPLREIPTHPWVFYDHREVLDVVRAGDLVPLESVQLTDRTGFWDAVDAGHENLRSRRDFEVLIDVRGARDGGVTPIPALEASRT